MSIDFEYLASIKERHTLDSLAKEPPWDLFISELNESDRVRKVFPRVSARSKHWLIAKEYDYSDAEIDGPDTHIRLDSLNESEALGAYARSALVDPNLRLCIDITGFMRPHILFLANHLKRIGMKQFDVIYSEPSMYKSRGQTKFYSGDIFEVRQVAGFEGVHIPSVSKDLLIIGAGYDHELVSQVATHKESARVLFLYGLPSLSADMYQENVLRMAGVSEALKGRVFDSGVAFTAANDPFVTASVLKSTYEIAKAKGSAGNCYFSPLSTKPQTLGFAIFYLRELEGQAASILFPFTERAVRDSSVGLRNIWLYKVEL